MTWLDYARKNNIEPCVKDKDGRIVAWCVGYSDNELKSLLSGIPDGMSVVLNLNNPKI